MWANSFNVAGLTCNAHCKYWRSIWLTSLNWNIPCKMIDHDLFEADDLAGQHERGYE